MTYSTGTGIDHYTYTFTVTGDTVLVVTIGATETLYLKENVTWVEVVAYKKVNGSWVLQTDLENLFDLNTNYVKGD